jgi:hypothetical protein
MPYETTEPWDMPLLNWEPEGSYESPISPPLLGPTGGTLVCIPPLNKEWVKIILGCLDQLRIPATWKAVDRADLLQALNWMQELKDVVASAGPCCDVAMRLTAGCVLQFSTDSGTTWADVTDWTTNFCTCVDACFINPVPPNPIPTPTDQHACNIAGFLATEIVQKTMTAVVAYVGTSLEQTQFLRDALQLIVFSFPISYAVTTAFTDFYDSVVTQVLAQVEAVRDDAVFWSDVTCAIFNAIRSVGYVTAGNFAAVHSNIAAISYTYPWAVAAVAAFWNDLGLQNIQALQNVGAVDDVDCSACGGWCYEYDFRTGTLGWASYSTPNPTTFTVGTGWVGANEGSFYWLGIHINFSGPITVNDVALWLAADHPNVSGDFLVEMFSGGTFVDHWVFTVTPDGAVHKYSTSGGASTTGDNMYVAFESATPGTVAHLETLQLKANTGVNPLGTQNCVRS